MAKMFLKRGNKSTKKESKTMKERPCQPLFLFFHFYVWMCMDVYPYLHVCGDTCECKFICMWMHVGVLTGEGLRSMWKSYLITVPPYPLKQGLSIKPRTDR